MWLRRPDAPKEATWEDYSEYYKDMNLNFTVSEIDREHKVEVVYKEQDIPNNGSEATQFLSQYYIQTHQGISIVRLFMLNEKNEIKMNSSYYHSITFITLKTHKFSEVLVDLCIFNEF